MATPTPIGANWADVWDPVWLEVWTQTPAGSSPDPFPGTAPGATETEDRGRRIAVLLRQRHSRAR